MARTLTLLLGLALVGICGLFTPPPAQAHGVLVRSSIGPGSLIADLPAELTLSFSEGLVTRLSSLSVTGPDGAAAAGEPVARPDGQSLQVRLRPHGGGTYRVSWTSVSAEDGQVLAGAFTFAVGYTSAPADLRTPVAAQGAGPLGVIGLLAALTHWLLLLLAISWAGAALFEMPPGTTVSRPALAGGDAWFALLAPATRILYRNLLEALLGVLVFGWLLEAAALATAGRTSLLGGLLALLDGRLGLLRLLTLAAPLLALLRLGRPAAVPPAQGAPGPARAPAAVFSPLARWGQLMLAVLFLLALAAGGHAGAVPTITLSSVVQEWLHSVAAAAWIGGQAYLVLTALPVLDTLDLDRRAPLLIGLLRRLGPFAGGGLAVLAITGLFAGQAQVGDRAHLLEAGYGRALLLKLLLVALAAALTGLLLFVQRAAAERTWTQRQRLESLAALDRIGRTLRLTTVLGVLILGATSVLWSTAPAAATPLPAIAAALPPQPQGAWQPVGLQGRVVYRVLFDPHTRHTLWAATDAGVWRSRDDQQTWTRQGATLRKLAILDLLFIDGDHGLLAAAANGQLYRTYNAGKTWQRLGRPFGHKPLRALAGHGAVLLAGGDDGLFRSIDDSRHWHRLPTAGDQGIGALVWSDSVGRFLAGAQRGPWQIAVADARGATWQVLPGAPGLPAGLAALAVSPDPAHRLLAGAGGSGLWVAPGPGGGWGQVTAGLPAAITPDALLADARTLGRLYLGTAGAGALGSADGGTSWMPLGQSRPSSVLCLVMRPGAVRILYAGTTHGIFKLTVGA